MRRADRLFDIIQTLRMAPHPVTAAALADKLEVTARTIYRDVAALQGSRVPIEGAPGLGYVTILGAWCQLRSDFRHFRVHRILSSQVGWMSGLRLTAAGSLPNGWR